MKLEYTITNKDTYSTVKDILVSEFKISSRLLLTLKKENCIFLNNSPVFVNNIINIGDSICVSFDYVEDNSNIVPTKMNLDIVYEDNCYIVVNKPFGIPVHPSMNHYEDSLSNGIRYYFDSIGLNKKIRPVNRIDRNTSGLVVFAKNEYIQESLIRQMATKDFKKEYIAVVEGFFKNKTGIINDPIARKEGSIIERCVDSLGDISITHYKVLKEFTVDNIDISVVRCLLETGRTHQIRVHMSYTGHPLLGDELYGGNLELINRQALHSNKISFIHPITRKDVCYTSTLPTDLNKFINFNINTY